MTFWIDAHPAGDDQHSGDFALHVRLDLHRSAVAVADVAGHGLVAGHAAEELQERVRALLLSSAPPASVLQSTAAFFDRELLSEAIPFATLFLAVVDERRDMIHYASAGHEPGLLFRGNRSHLHLDPTGPILGFPMRAIYRERTLPFEANDVLVVVTDGITESRREAGGQLEFFGSRGVARAVAQAHRDGNDPARTIQSHAHAHANGRLTDDASACVIRMDRARHTRRTARALGSWSR